MTRFFSTLQGWLRCQDDGKLSSVKYEKGLVGAGLSALFALFALIREVILLTRKKAKKA